ncbi:MAG: hydroxyacylglutathione hydrolase [Planctomycetota bacterium]|jgi:hydroxyacylglutathione hydrolase
MHKLILLVLCLLVLPLTAQADVTDWLDQGQALAGISGDPVLTGSGNLASGGTVNLLAENLAPSSLTILVVGFQANPLPFFGGILLPNSDAVLGPFPTSPQGKRAINATLSPGFPDGLDLFFQFWTADNAATQGVSGTNAIRATPTSAIEPGVFPSSWISGAPNCGTDPDIQVHYYNQNFVILRQSICTNFEGPFMFLLFGDDEVLMLDTGAGNVNLAGTVQTVIDDWLIATGKPSIDLTIVHTHGHGDHTAGDAQMKAQFPNAKLVPANVAEIKNVFGIANWPTDIASYDLGNRVVDIIPLPGHETAHLAFYDNRTGTLMTGDSLYPGRLYVFGATSQDNWSVFRDSIERLVNFTATRTVCWVLGNHIEMSTTPGDDYPIGAASHPNEHRLQLERKHLIELNDALQANPTPVTEVHDDFIITPIG